MPLLTDSYFTATTSGLPYGPGDELHRSIFLMGNLDGAEVEGEQAPATNCLHCQLVHVLFFSVSFGEGFYFVRRRLFLEIPHGSGGNQTALICPIGGVDTCQQAEGSRTVGCLDGRQFESRRRFQQEAELIVIQEGESREKNLQSGG